MIKTFTVAIIFAVTFWATPVFAEEDAKTALSIESMTDRPLDNPADGKIKVSEIKRGVFVTAVGGWSTVYPKTAQMVKDRLMAKGVKVVDAPAEADIGLQFGGNPFDLEEVETQIDAGIDKTRLTVNTLSALANPITFLASALATSSGDKVKTMIIVRVADAPTVSGRGKMNGDGKRNVFVISDLVYHTNHQDATVSTMVFTAYVEQFIEKHFIFDQQKMEAVIAVQSAVTAPTTLSVGEE